MRKGERLGDNRGDLIGRWKGRRNEGLRREGKGIEEVKKRREWRKKDVKKGGRGEERKKEKSRVKEKGW